VSETATLNSEDVKNSASYRSLKAVVIFLGALIVVAFVLLVVGLVLRFAGKGGSVTAAGASIVELPAGSRIVSSQVQGDRLILRTSSPEGEAVYIVDTSNGRLVGRLAAVAPKVR
jgi:hypothetical protein